MSDTGAHRSTSADEALARIEDGIAGARERADRAAAFRSAYESLDASGESRQDGVRVTLDASGLLTALSLTDEGASRSGRQVAAGIMRAHAEAVQRLREDVETLAADAFGAGSSSATAVVEELSTAVPDQHDPSTGSTW